MIPLRSSGGIAPTSVELLGNQAWDSSTALSILSFATVSSFSGVILPLSLSTEEDLQTVSIVHLIESIADISVSELAGSVAKVCLIGTWRL